MCNLAHGLGGSAHSQLTPWQSCHGTGVVEQSFPVHSSQGGEQVIPERDGQCLGKSSQWYLGRSLDIALS